MPKQNPLRTLLVLLWLLTVVPAAAFGQEIAVLYPDLGEPYRSFFGGIIQGIEEKAKARVKLMPVGSNSDPNEMAAQLRRQDVKVAIALGRQGLKVANALDRDVGLVVGGVLSAPEAERPLTGISLSPDPGLLLARLRKLVPSIRRVHVVYDPKHNEWLMRLAREAARVQGVELLTYEAQDLRTASRLYQEILSTSEAKRDALWLPQDPTTVEENVVLPLVLREAWERGLIVFSSTFIHVKRGVLFSLYPDNVELGRSLAAAALSHGTNGNGSKGMQPLREVLMAVNLRTAGHIGLNISYQQQRGFDFVFPEP